MRKIIGTATLFIALLIPLSISAQAGTESGIIVSPPYLEKNINSGEQIVQNFSVINQRNQQEEFTVYLKEQGELTIQNGEDTNRLDFVTIEPTNFTLQPGGRQEVTVVISPPDTTRTAGYYSELGFRVNTGGGDTTLGVAPEVAIPLISNVQGAEPGLEDLTVFSFDHLNVDFDFLYEYLPVTFNTTLTNVGDYHVRPSGNIFISNSPEFKTDQIISNLDFNPADQFLFAGTSREFENVWDEGLFTLNEQQQLEVEFGKPAQFGKYYAQLNIFWTVGERDRFLSSQTEFWVVPWKLVLASAIGITGLITSRVIYLRLQTSRSYTYSRVRK